MRKKSLMYHWFHDTYIEKDILKGCEDVSSREELQSLADEDPFYPRINWKKWNSLVEKTKQDINNVLQEHKEKEKYKNNKKIEGVYVYNFLGELIKTFNDALEAAQHYNISRVQVTNYMRTEQPYYKLQIVFSRRNPII